LVFPAWKNNNIPGMMGAYDGNENNDRADEKPADPK